MADEIWNQGNLAVADELFANDFVNHDPNPGAAADLESCKGWVLKWRAAFPDYHVEVHDLIAEGDKVGARYTVTGTHQGELFGVAASEIQVTMKGINIYRLDHGKIAEVHRSYDLLGVEASDRHLLRGRRASSYSSAAMARVRFVSRAYPKEVASRFDLSEASDQLSNRWRWLIPEKGLHTLDETVPHARHLFEDFLGTSCEREVARRLTHLGAD